MEEQLITAVERPSLDYCELYPRKGRGGEEGRLV